MSSPATNGVPSGTAEAVPGQAEYNPHHLVGSLMDEEEEPIPLLFFTSIPEAWVCHLSLFQRISRLAIPEIVVEFMPIFDEAYKFG